MLMVFRVANFRSLRDEQELSLVRSSQHRARESMGQERGGDAPEGGLPGGWDPTISPVAAVYGANGSGKSNLIQAMAFMVRAVRESHSRWSPDQAVPVEPFLLDAGSRNQPSFFEVEVRLAGVRHQYGFRLDAARVVEEWLYVYPTGRRQTWFEREPDGFYFGKNLTGHNRIIAELTRPNSLFLSTAGANNHKQLGALSRWFERNVRSVSSKNLRARERSTTRMLGDPARVDRVVDLLRFADLGIVGARLHRRELDERSLDLAVSYLRSGEHLSENDVLRALDRASVRPEFTHSGKEGELPVPYEQESEGTKSWYAMIGPVIYALDRKRVLLVDELSANLHPRLARELIRIFADPSLNPRQAQLVFATHDTTPLGNLQDEPALERDQVWLAEKGPDGASRIYPLTDFSPRRLENLERGYLQGRYGAVPVLDRERLTQAARKKPDPDDGEPQDPEV